MPKRMLQVVGGLLAGLLAVAFLAVGPSGASGHTPPTAKAAGNGGGCYDQWPPSSQWGNNWWGHDDGGRYWNGWGDGNDDNGNGNDDGNGNGNGNGGGGYFDGSSSDSGCSGYQSGRSVGPGKGKVARVMVAAKRVRGSHCQNVSRSGHLGKVGSCGRTHWMRAKGTTSWRMSIPHRLPKGHYQLLRRAVDAAGNREHPHRLHLRIR